MIVVYPKISHSPLFGPGIVSLWPMDAKSPPPFLYQISVLHLRAGETESGGKLFEVVEASGSSNWNLDLK